jgi:hypothetical protein
MRKALVGACAALAAAAALIASSGAAAAPVAAVEAAPAAGGAPQLTSSPATYTWTRTDPSGRVVFTRTGVVTDEHTSFGSLPADGLSSGELSTSAEQQPAPRGPLREISPTACCSPSGCDAVDVVRDVGSILWGSTTLARFHHRVYWCWSYPRITGVNVSCYASDIKGWLGVLYLGCGGGGSYYTWAGSGQGGHYSYRQGDFQQCAFDLCTTHRYPWIQIWVNGNGAWAQSQGG